MFLRAEKNKFKVKFLYKPFLNSTLINSINWPSINLYSDDLTSHPSYCNILNFKYYNNDILQDVLDNNYESSKHYKFLYFNNYQNIFLGITNHSLPLSYVSVLDSFRADFDEANWDLNYKKIDLNNSQGIIKNTSNLTNNIKLRSTAKNSIVTYNANQKVYKSRFDDLRSNINFQNIINSYTNYPFLTEPKSHYEGILGKNKESFFNTNHYSTEFSSGYSIFLSI